MPRYMSGKRLALAPFAFMTLLAPQALAAAGDPCASNSDCGSGESCHLAPPIACPEIAVMCDGDAAPIDADGDGCALECPEEVVCAAVVVECDGGAEPIDADHDGCALECPEDSVAFAEGTCLADPVACDSDADCGEGEVCETYTYGSCTGAVAPCMTDDQGNLQCDDMPETDPECTEVTESLCVPRYFAGCAEDADCGPGFTCEPLETCTCSGSGGGASSGTDGGASSPAPDESECVCEPALEGYCQLEDLPCETDEQCPAGLVCSDAPSAAQDCTVSSDGTTTCASPGDENERRCTPPFYDLGPVPGAEFDEDASATGGADRDEEENVPCPAVLVQCEDGSEPIDEDGDGCALECPDDDAEDDEDEGDDDDEDGPLFVLNCASAGADPTAMSLLGALGLLGLRRRRR